MRRVGRNCCLFHCNNLNCSLAKGFAESQLKGFAAFPQGHEKVPQLLPFDSPVSQHPEGPAAVVQSLSADSGTLLPLHLGDVAPLWQRTGSVQDFSACTSWSGAWHGPGEP